MGTALLDGLIAGYGIAIPVGAIALLIVGVSMRCGFVCGFSAGAGAATADLVYALVAAAAGSAVAAALAPWEQWIRIASALVLLSMAIWGLWAVRRRRDDAPTEVAATPTRSDLAGTYFRFVGLTVINPMTVVYFAALVMGAGIAGGGWTATLAFVLGAFAASLSWQTLLAAVGAMGRRRLSPRLRNYTLVLGNLIVLLLAGRIVVG